MRSFKALASGLALLFGICVVPGASEDQVPPVPRIEVLSFAEKFAPAYLGNGLLGIRPGPNPLVQAKTMAAGFVYSHRTGGFETMSLAPYPLGTDFRVGGTSLLGEPNLVIVRSQVLDMATGELTTDLTFPVGDSLKLDLEITQFVSRTVPSLLCQEIRITPSEDVVVEILPKILRDEIPGSVFRDRIPTPRVHVDQVLGMKSDRGSKIGIALLIPPQPGLERKETGIFAYTLKKGEDKQFRTIAAVVTDAYHPDPDLQAIRVASWGGMLGFDVLRQRNRDQWAQLWRSRVKVYGDNQAQRALDAAFFYLHSSAHPASVTGVPPFGMSQWANYFGHVFWDMDHWILPAVLPASPGAAKAMLMYRFKGLAAAKAKAASFGFAGAMYPWEGGLDGAEVTPSEATTGWAEQHTVPEVALAAWEYYSATRDSLFLRDAGWPVIRDVAEWIANRGNFTSRGYEIPNVMGPNEWLTNANNDSHVNLLCKMAMTAAVACAKEVGAEAPIRWVEVEKRLYLPVDSQRNVVLPFSPETPIRFYNEPLGRYEEASIEKNPRAYTLSNMQMVFFHDPPLPYELYRNTWLHEEKLRTERVSDPSVPASVRAPGFTTPPLAACAAFFGDRKKAAELFRLAWKEYTLEPYLINKEYRPRNDGNYLMNQASLLMAAMYGFTGLRISLGDWRKYEATLPEGWQRIEIDRIWIRGEAYKVVAEHGKKPELIRQASESEPVR